MKKNHNKNRAGKTRLSFIGDHYGPRISPDRPHFEILDWASAESQKARFSILADNVNLAGKKLLDVGCGLGDLFGFLREQNILVHYTGVDLLAKMVQAARKIHPAGVFVQADLFQNNPFDGECFDVVFCSGAFNLNLGNNKEFLRLAIRALYSLTKEHLVFNLLHRRAAAQEETYYYYDPSAVMPALKSLNCKVDIIDDYLHNDFTVICTKTAN